MSQQYPELEIIYNCTTDHCFACYISLKDGKILEKDIVDLDKGEHWSPEWEQKEYKLLQRHDMLSFISCPDCDALVPSYYFPSKEGVNCPMCNADMINDKTSDAISDIIKNRSIETLDLSVRSHNCLKRDGKNTVGDLLQMTDEDFQKTRNLGLKSAQEVIHKLIDLDVEQFRLRGPRGSFIIDAKERQWGLGDPNALQELLETSLKKAKFDITESDPDGFLIKNQNDNAVYKITIFHCNP